MSDFAPYIPSQITDLTNLRAELDDRPTATEADAAYANKSATTAALEARLRTANNLADLADKSAAQANLGLGGAATKNVGTVAGTVADGSIEQVLDRSKARTDFAYAVVDIAGRIAFGVRADGTVDIGSTMDIAGKTTLNTAAATANQLAMNSLKSVLDTGARSNLAWAVVDSSNQIALGVGTDGKVQIGATLDATAAMAASAALATVVSTSWTTRSGIAWGVVDSTNQMPLAVDAFGSVLIEGKRFSDISAPALRVPSLELATYGSNCISMWGDSITRGSGSSTGKAVYAQLAVLLNYQAWNTQAEQPNDQNATRPYVYCGGYGGARCDQIMARQGGRQFLISLTGDTIPASGPVALTSLSPDIGFTVNEISVTGFLNGVYGTLAASTGTTTGATATYTFTRLIAGSAVTVYKNTLFHVAERGHDATGAVYSYQHDRSYDINIFWQGVNDSGATNSQIYPSVVAGVNHLKAAQPRFIVMSYLNGSQAPYLIGTDYYNAREAIEAQYRGMWPNNFLDVRRILVESYNPALAQDVIDHGNDTVPTSLRSDTIHLNDAGYTIVANSIYKFLLQKGWV